MIRILLLAVSVYAFLKIRKFFRTLKSMTLDESVNRLHEKEGEEELVEDPQCHTYVAKSQSIRKYIRGQEYRFCSPECAKAFARGAG